MQDDFADLAAFAILCESGSFTRAAERLGCSKGQLSKRIRALELRLQTTLLHRTTRRLDPTTAGRALLPEAQALLQQRERALQSVARLREEAAGQVRLTVPVSLGYTFFEVLLSCRAAHPHIQLDLVLDNGYRDLVAEGFDLAIRARVEPDERLVARPLFAMEEVTCAAPAYLAGRPLPTRPEDLLAQRCVVNNHYAEGDVWLYHRDHQLSRIRVASSLACNHYSLLKQAALAGHGIARLPSFMVHEELAAGTLVWLLKEWRTPSLPLFLVHPYQSGLPKRTRVVAEALSDWFERSRQRLEALG
ncbi:LysR family transcriptional regulator [Pseudomonas oryzihabitans]|nr:LysR family transcriptional regulator [Pseudomonas psychrotolerans]KTT42689.1 LysR family transcriptional regulator [Pseudomonas psychrotolerans]